ncbi:hypothetical protein NTE_01624 [Candidatus Nitrososphaera evergladensis SR1]|uniref:Uncharacterized protein n=1 Tax=Candidatus Nitrososphaera evergladensis SR1 TaxID=1459636 RepID=A0A075MQ49_9ARCH|nr:hypothetical protein NTE_01624 [Candidatus Nitrososphaera evergladensis SR1]
MKWIKGIPSVRVNLCRFLVQYKKDVSTHEGVYEMIEKPIDRTCNNHIGVILTYRQIFTAAE